ncbi:MAG TPA: RsmB/NOP family class I SAM-dependent RNA methyltransferase [Candidatus Nanoarchaeia archaeon]|nr:RsmB/NOP family class I SAM-dependent RNA methyltransferase [Candidatus Nanoarchaeia archaeon]
MTKFKPPEPKTEFLERMELLLPEKEDYKKYLETIKSPAPKSIRVNKIKISSENLFNKLVDKGWKVRQPWKDYPEIIIVDGDKENPQSGLEPGVLGRTFEHLLGYYYVQELSSCLPIIALKPFSNKKDSKEKFLDLCAAPGSKTTQAASEMENQGVVIANDLSIGRIKVLASNLERCGATNTIITKKDGIVLARELKNKGYEFDKILVDAPCSGEGTLRSSPKTALMWNIKTVKGIRGIQKKLAESAFELLKPSGEMIYSTCTHAPEENEEIVDHLLKKYGEKIGIEKIELPLKTRKGIISWQEEEYDERVKYAHRIYPQDNNTDGFFLAKLKKIK